MGHDNDSDIQDKVEACGTITKKFFFFVGGGG